MSYSSSNEAFQKRQRNREKEKTRALDQAVILLMGNVDGRAFVWDLVHRRCGWSTVYKGGDSNVYRSEGRRAVAEGILDDLNRLCPDLITTMDAEQRRSAALDRTLARDVEDQEESPDAA